jgi:hypothetical protein
VVFEVPSLPLPLLLPVSYRSFQIGLDLPCIVVKIYGYILLSMRDSGNSFLKVSQVIRKIPSSVYLASK